MIKRTIESEVTPTPEELAECFWEMGSDQQAVFFNKLGEISGHFLCFQLQAVIDSETLNREGRHAMGVISDYAEKQV